jgi:hypothetical protein
MDKEFMTAAVCEERHKNVMGKLGSLEMMTGEIYKKIFMDNGESWSTQIKLSTEFRKEYEKKIAGNRKELLIAMISLAGLIIVDIITRI